MTTPPIEDSIEDKLWILGTNYGYFYDPILNQEPEEDRLNREAFIGQVQALLESEKAKLIGEDEDLNAPLDREVDGNPESDKYPLLYVIRRAVRNEYRRAMRERAGLQTKEPKEDI